MLPGGGGLVGGGLVGGGLVLVGGGDEAACGTTMIVTVEPLARIRPTCG